MIVKIIQDTVIMAPEDKVEMELLGHLTTALAGKHHNRFDLFNRKLYIHNCEVIK